MDVQQCGHRASHADRRWCRRMAPAHRQASSMHRFGERWTCVAANSLCARQRRGRRQSHRGGPLIAFILVLLLLHAPPAAGTRAARALARALPAVQGAAATQRGRASCDTRKIQAKRACTVECTVECTVKAINESDESQFAHEVGGLLAGERPAIRQRVCGYLSVVGIRNGAVRRASEPRGVAGCE